MVVALTVRTDLRGAIGFSGVTILSYYAITNAACLTLPPQRRRWHRSINVAGLVGCVTLAALLPATVVLNGVSVLTLGLIVRHLAARA